MANDLGKSRTVRTSLTALSSLLNYAVIIMVGFLVSPILLSSLGSSLFGTWKICQRLLTYVSAADGKATQALKWTIATKQITEDDDAKRRDVGCALTVWVRFLPLVLALGIPLAWFSPYLVRQLPPEHFLLTRLTCSILVVNLIILPLRSVPEAAMIGMNLAYKCAWVNVFGSVLGAVLMVAAAYSGWGLVGLASAVLCASVVRGVLMFFTARRNLSWFGVQRPQKKEFKDFFGFSIWVFANTFVSKFMLSSDIIIVGLVFSAVTVTSYSLTNYAIQATADLMVMLVSAALPGLGGVVGNKDFVKASAVRNEIMVFSWLITTVLGSMMLLWNFSFVKLWVGTENFVGFTENFVMVLMMTQFVFIRNDARIVDVTLNIKNKVLLGAASTIFSLALAYLLSRYWFSNIAGMVLGLMLGRVLLSISYPILVKRAFKLKSAQKISALFQQLLVMVLLYAVTLYMGSQVVVGCWSSFILFAPLSFLFILALAFFLGLSSEYRDRIISRLSQIWRPRTKGQEI